MPATRRNGQLWSCEPCRKSKLRCDHVTPVCGRCAQRNKEHLCTYHPAPLTNTTPSGQKWKRKNKPPVNFKGRSDDWGKKKGSVSTPGFLGYTSYNNVFADRDSGLHMGNATASQDTPSIDIEKLQLGARALEFLKNLPLYRKILVSRYKVWKGWTLGWPMANMILTGAEDMWKSIQEEEPDESQQTLLMSRRLFEKQNEPMEIHSDMSWTEFAHAANGRWETIGLLFTAIGLAAELEYIPNKRLASPQGLDEPSEPQELHGLIVTFTGIADLCVQFCDTAGIINDMVCWLLLSHVALLTVVYGEGDYRPWRKLGDLATAVFALGLHQQSENCPFFLQQMRARIMVATYAFDKEIATFLGRPPLVSSRYCDLQMPLDISWDELFAEPAVRDAAIANLSSDGWNLEGSMDKGAWARVILLQSMARENVLEITLSRQTNDLPQRVEYVSSQVIVNLPHVHELVTDCSLLLFSRTLSQELHRQYNGLPDFLRWNPGKGLKGTTLGDQLLIDLHLEYLYNHFLLYRLLEKRANIHTDKMMHISLDIMNALLSMVDQTYEYPSMIRNVIWNLCYVGLPSAGILSADLLRPRPRTTEPSAFSRSDIIQKLSIFAHHLGTLIKSDEGNYNIAQQGQRAIRRVLDQVLSAPQLPTLPPTDPAADLGLNEAFVDSDLLNGIDVDDRGPFLDWLDGALDVQEPWLAWMSLK